MRGDELRRLVARAIACVVFATLMTSVQSVSAQKAPSKGTPSGTMLTDDEKQIAVKLGFTENVLELIKHALSPRMAVGKKGGLEEDDDGFERAVRFAPISLLPQDEENYIKIKNEFPDLTSLVDQELQKYDSTSKLANRMASQEKRLLDSYGPEKYARYQKFNAALQPYHSFLAKQAAADLSTGGMKLHVLMDPGASGVLESDEALESAIAAFQKDVANQKLLPENAPRLYLSLRFWGVGDQSYVGDRRISGLRDQLDTLGYRITEESRPAQHSKMFETRKEAEDYLRETGSDISMLTMREQPAQTLTFKYPDQDDGGNNARPNMSSLQSLLSSLGSIDPSQMAQMMKGPGALGKLLTGPRATIPPGSSVKKLDNGQWSLTVPERFIATTIEREAAVTKKSKADDQFELVRINRTDGTNYGLSTDDILKKLSDWNDRYGIDVADAGADRMTVRFKTLPEDLAAFCTECFLFCPDVVDLHGDENEKAARLRDFAKAFTQEQQITFWWD